MAVPEAETMARWSLTQGLWPCPVALFATTVAWAVESAPILAAVATGMAAAVMGLGGLLVFDGLLFRVIASYPAEQPGCAAVDDTLSRMRLKPPQGTTRSLAARIAGTRRIVLRQRVALAIALAATAGAISLAMG
jgi:hypothetical protein